MAATIIGGLLQGGVFALVALGFALVYRVTGIVNLCQGAFCLLGALGMYILQVTLGWPASLAATASIVATTSFGALLGLATFVPALKRLPTGSMFMLTAGLLTLIEGLVLVLWGSDPINLPAFSGEAPVRILGVRVATQAFWIVGVGTLVVFCLWYLLMHTIVGKQLRACAENPLAARLMGINVTLMSGLSFSLAAMIGAIGGIVAAPITSLQFDSGTFFTISGFIAVAIGGMGSFVGAIAGGLLLGTAEQFAAGYVSSLFSNGIAVLLLLIVLMVRPGGLFGAHASRRTDVRDEQQIHLAIPSLENRTVVTLSVAAVSFLVVLPWLISDDSILPSLIITGILFIGVLGLDVLMGFAGQISLGQGAFMAIGGYTAALLAIRLDWPPLLGIAAGIALSIICATGLSLVTMRLRGVYLALATLAFSMFVDSLLTGLMDLTGGPSGLVGIPSLSVGRFVFTTPLSMYYLVLALGVLLVALLAGLTRSSFGRALKAIRADQLAAAAVDINVPRYKTAAFVISAVLASLSGSLFAFYFHYLSPDMVGISRSLEMVTMLVVGGEGMLVGSLAGVALLTLLPELFQPLAVYKTLAEGILLVVTFQYFPEGISGFAVNKVLPLIQGSVRRHRIRTPLTQDSLQ